MQKLITKFPNITNLVLEDITLFEKEFKKEPHIYGNGWTYITQGAYKCGENNLGYKLITSDGIITFRINYHMMYKDKPVIYWVRPLGNNNLLNTIKDISNYAIKQFKIPSYIKKLTPQQYEYLLESKWTSTSKYPWHTTAHSEDDTYPELIFKREKTLDVAINGTRNDAIHRNYLDTLDLSKDNEIKVEEKNFEKRAWEITEKFFNLDIIKKKKDNISKKWDYYNPIFNNPPRKNLERKIVLVNSEPIGFYITENNQNYTNHYAHIFLRNKYSHIVDWSKINLFKKNTTKFINMGGSETPGIYQFKQKYIPIKKQPLFWATNWSLLD